MGKIKANSLEEYYALVPDHAKEYMLKMRQLLKKIAPNATETLKWGQPVFEEKRILFAIAAYSTHLNFIPTGPALAPFFTELSTYTLGKDSVQFKYNQPLPLALIEKIAQYRHKAVVENDAKWMY
jgi:uncharacterized protein YdhG (YjbR/CyaY superfamily)